MLTEEIVVEHHSVSLSCPALGNPFPRITWYRHGAAGEPVRQLTGNELGVRVLLDGTLVLDSAQIDSAGVYVCRAENSAGMIEHNITLTVHCKSCIA